MAKIAAHPALYSLDHPKPLLRGARCISCQTAFFPNFGIGCEVCGATPENLVVEELPTLGTVHTIATVWVHDDPNSDLVPYQIQTPFTVAEIALNAGPFIRALMSDNQTDEIIGRQVEAVWIVAGHTASGDQIMEPRFELTTDK